MTMDWSATLLDAAGVARRTRPTRWTACRCCRCCATPAHAFARPLHWRMNHRGQRALRDGDWKYLRVDGHDYLFDLAGRRARARQPAPRASPSAWPRMRAAWEAWNATMPPIPTDATVSLGYSAQGHAAALMRVARPARATPFPMPSPTISPRAFVMLLLLACMFGGNHVAARIALDHGVDVATAVAVRSLATARWWRPSSRCTACR